MELNKKGVNNIGFAPLSFFFKQDNKSILLSVLLLYQTKGWKNGKAWLEYIPSHSFQHTYTFTQSCVYRLLQWRPMLLPTLWTRRATHARHIRERRHRKVASTPASIFARRAGQNSLGAHDRTGLPARSAGFWATRLQSPRPAQKAL